MKSQPHRPRAMFTSVVARAIGQVLRDQASAPISLNPNGWRTTPFGSSDMTPMKNRRMARKKASVKRARRLGHA